MLQTKQDLQYYLEKDYQAGEYKYNKPRLIGDEEWKYIIRLRKLEYYQNNQHSLLNKLLFLYHKYRFRNMGFHLGFSIPPNVCGPGLYLPHKGTIVINGNTRIGKNCRIHVCVNIGEDNNEQAPVIGDNVYIAPGAKIFGGITIADNTIIGANAVVNKSFLEPNTVIAGVPAKVVKVLKPENPSD